MSPGILGKKIGMTQLFRPDGQVVPVTLLKAGPCMVVQRKTPTTDGYDAVQLGLVEFIKPQRINKPTAGRLKKAGVDGAKFMREFPLRPGDGDMKPGDQVLVDQFKPKDKVDVVGISKGRGFAGVVKRHHMKGQARNAASAHEVHRHMGAVGMRKTPGRVFKGKRMPGHMGVEKKTVQNLSVVDVIPESNLLLISGSVPGYDKSLVVVRPAVK